MVADLLLNEKQIREAADHVMNSEELREGARQEEIK